MFDTVQIAKRIREARIAQNMTQMALADEMGVSYQAVSNWERGNSLPDISKLEQLCQVLHISLDDLLGTGVHADAVAKVLRKDDTVLTMKELEDVAPMLPPAEMQKQVSSTAAQGTPLDFSALACIAPFLDSEYLEALAENASVEHLEDLLPLAPFFSQETLDRLAGNVPSASLSTLGALAPFLSQTTLETLVGRCMDAKDPDALSALAPFLSQETLDALVEQNMDDLDPENLAGLYPFLGRETIRKIAEKLLGLKSFDRIREIGPFL